jgi:hypothetical protein
MTFDAHSRERLAALGRQLPQKLDPPAPHPREASAGRAEPPRHAVETEQDPEQLFRELMGASADGSVPPHLLDRLRALELQRRPGSSSRMASPAGATTAPDASPTPSPARWAQPPGRRPAMPSVQKLQDAEHQELYTAFQQLLLEDDALD